MMIAKLKIYVCVYMHIFKYTYLYIHIYVFLSEALSLGCREVIIPLHSAPVRPHIKSIVDSIKIMHEDPPLKIFLAWRQLKGGHIFLTGGVYYQVERPLL